MPSQTVMPAGGAAKSAPSGSGPPRDRQQPIEQVDTSQSSDQSQMIIQAFQSILAQQLSEQREQLEEKLDVKLREQR